MALDSSEVEKIAHLARLAVAAEDTEALGRELSGILDLVVQMNAIDTSEVAPMAHPLDMTQRLRTDEVTEENRREDFQEIAPLTEAGLYLVPRVIE
jgi:aspartyl-tRNA(Asn)/glutamyl-tRNA(Gln) amidotransferase subunit C